MQLTTLVSGLTALAFFNTAAAVAVRLGAACKHSPYSALSHWPAARSFCSALTVTTTVTSSLSAEATEAAAITGLEAITLTETSTAVAPSTLLPKAKRDKCHKPNATKPAKISSVPSSSYLVQSSSSASQHALYSSLISGPSSIAESACRCIGTPVTITATSTAVASGFATAAAQSAGTVTITTTMIVTRAALTSTEATVYEIGSTSSTNTGTETSTSSASEPSATSACSTMGSTYTTDNELAFSVTCNSLYGASGSNTISQTEQPDFQSCIDACSTTDSCAYLLYVGNIDYSSARQCYLLNAADAGFGTGYAGVDTAQLIAP